MVTLRAGRAALARGAWAEARASFEAALGEEETAEALEGLSWAAWWLDDVDACFDARERAYRAYRAAGDLRGAARMALWLSDDYAEFRREEAVVRRLVPARRAAARGAPARAGARLAGGLRGARDARRGRPRGRAAARRRRRASSAASSAPSTSRCSPSRPRASRWSPRARSSRGMRRLDEAAAAALGGEFEDLRAAGWTCCLLIGACERVRDFGRAAQWCAEAEAFGRRLDIRFVNGVCRAHYGAVLCWHGDWEGAERELTGALDELTEKRPAWRSVAVVRLGELRRRQGRIARRSSCSARRSATRSPGSGAPRPRSTAATRRAARDDAARLLRATAAPMARAGRAGAARRARAPRTATAPRRREHAAELRAIAGAVPTGPLRAAASYCEGLAAAAAGDHAAALAAPRAGGRGLRGQRGAARDRPRAARARRGARRARAATRPRGARRRRRRGARRDRRRPPSAERARAVAQRLGAVPPGELSAREVEVLRLVAEASATARSPAG